MAASEFFRELKESSRNIDLNNLDPQNPGVWPLVVKVVVWVFCAAAVIAGGYIYVLTPLREELATAQQQEASLKTTFEDKANKAANLEAYRKQMVEMEALFKALVSQLPSDTEVPGLLEDISQIGEKSGLKIKEIGLQPEQSKEIFVELPISLSLAGAYHDLGSFVSGIASMPRIVTLHDFTITRDPAAGAGNGQLNVSILAKTYRFRKQGDK